jgi:hypothetical protein
VAADSNITYTRLKKLKKGFVSWSISFQSVENTCDIAEELAVIFWHIAPLVLS